MNRNIKKDLESFSTEHLSNVKEIILERLSDYDIVADKDLVLELTEHLVEYFYEQTAS